jgi:hypothetical protein
MLVWAADYVDFSALFPERRSRFDLRPLFDRRSPINRRSSSGRISTPLRRSSPDRRPVLERLSSLVMPFLHKSIE